MSINNTQNQEFVNSIVGQEIEFRGYKFKVEKIIGSDKALCKVDPSYDLDKIDRLKIGLRQLQFGEWWVYLPIDPDGKVINPSVNHKREFGKTKEKPVALVVDFERLPTAIKEHKSCLLWSYVWDDKREEWGKVPVQTRAAHPEYRKKWNLRFYRAATTKPKTHSPCADVQDYYQGWRECFDGCGLVLNNGLLGVDLDNCRDRITGVIKPWAVAIIDELDSYTEVSPSGTGVKVFLHASLDDVVGGLGINPKDKPYKVQFEDGEVEVYDHTSPRYFTVTGHRLDDQPHEVERRQDQFAAVYLRLYAARFENAKLATARRVKARETKEAAPIGIEDQEVVDLCLTAKNKAKFARLYRDGNLNDYGDDWSRADMALVQMLAFWVGDDSERIDRIFRSSRLYRDKWDRDDYRNRTIDKAIARTDEFFDWTATERMKIDDRQGRILDDLFARTDAAPERVEPTVRRDEAGIFEAGDESFKKENYKSTKKRRGYRPSEIRQFEEPKWLVKDHLVENTICGIFGAPSSFKSFYGLDLAFSVATGTPFLGAHEVVQGAVLYLYAEGVCGMRRRMSAWEKARGVTLPDDMVCILPHSFHLTGENAGDEVKELLETAREILGTMPTIVFIDTLSRNFGGGDENATKDMKSFVDIMDQIKGAAEGAVVPIHHSGKDPGRKERGSNVLRASVDTLIGINRNDQMVATVTCEKMKDGEEFAPYKVRASEVEWAIGKKSLVLNRDDGDGRTTNVASLTRQQTNDRRNLRVFRREPQEAITRATAARRWDCSIETAKPRINDLMERGFLVKIDGENHKTGKANLYHLSITGGILAENEDPGWVF
jgi:hypothetical protein